MKKLNFNLPMWAFALAMLGNLIVNAPANAEDAVSTDILSSSSTTTTADQSTTSTVDTATTTIDATTTTLDVSTTTTDILSVTTTPTLGTTTTMTSTTTVDTSTPTSTPADSQTNTASNSSSSQNALSATNNNSAPPQLIDQATLRSAAEKIINFLKSQIDQDGKIIDGGTTDWSAMSFAADGQYAGQIDPNLLAQIKQYNFSDPSDLNVCAGYPRHLLALLAAGLPANDGSVIGLVNQIKNTCWQTGGIYGQAGINDDVFGLFALLTTGNTVTEPIITTIINTLQADQTTEGSFTWNGWPSPDITGASINALKYAQTRGANIDSAIFSRAKSYLKSNQLPDGGWGFGVSDPLTTSWALMGINALGELQNDWQNSQGNNPWGALISTIKDGGYYESAWAPGTIDWFGTKHAAPALMNKSWPIILTPTAVAVPAAQTTTASATANNYGDTSTSVSTNTPETSTTSTTSTTNFTTTTIVNTALDPTTSTTSSTTSTAGFQSNTATADVVTTGATSTPTATSIATNNEPEPTRRINTITKQPARNTTEQPLQLTTAPVEPTLSAGPVETKSADDLINQLPLDSPSRKTAKKILVLSGGSTVALGAYLGLRLLRGVL